jgi:hypothetical protein
MAETAIIDNRILWALAILLLTLVAAGAVYKVWPLLHPEISLIAPPDPACDLRRGPCVGLFPNGGRVQLSIEPPTLPVARPLHIEVRTKGLRADAIEVDFAGVDMDMGFNRRRLQALASDRFVGEAMLPVCVRTRMLWEARVLVQRDQNLLAALFRFEGSQPGATSPP